MLHDGIRRVLVALTAVGLMVLMSAGGVAGSPKSLHPHQPGRATVAAPLFTIAGAVSEAGGGPVAGIRVAARTAMGVVNDTTTQADGTYALSIAAGTYVITFVDAAGTYPMGWYSAAGFVASSSQATPIPVSAADVSGIDVALPLAHHVSGTVTGAGAAGLGGIAVTARNAGGDDVAFATTAGDGTYSLPVAPGTFTIRYAGTQDYLGGWYSPTGLTGDQTAAVGVPVSSGDVAGIDVELPRALHISGTVTGAGAAGLAGIDVAAYDSGFVVVAHATTGPDGAYSVALAPGTYAVGFVDPVGGFAAGWYSTGGFVAVRSAATPVAVDATDVAAIDVTLPTPRHMTGTVTSVGGIPIAGITVVAYDPDGNRAAQVMTAVDGTYSLAVPAGTYLVTFCDFSLPPQFLNGWYSATGLVADQASATPVDVALSDIPGLDAAMTPAVRPAAPGGVSAVAGTQQATVSWTAPAPNGGPAILVYAVTSQPDGHTCTTTGALSCTVAALTNNISYTFTVTATNAAGDGTPSAPSRAVAPTTGTLRAAVARTSVGRSASSTIPVALSWATGLDGAGVTYQVRRMSASTNLTLPTPGARSLTVAAAPGARYTYQVRAITRAGALGAWLTGSSWSVVALQDSSRSISFKGTGWTRSTLGSPYGGTVHATSTAGRTAATSVTTAGIAWVSTLGKDRGKAEVWLDGIRVATVNLYRKTTAARQIVWSTSFATAGTHRLVIKVLGRHASGATGNRVDVDSFLVIRP